MPNDLSVWSMVLDASPIVQAVVALLLLASVMSWAIIFRKSRVISHCRRTADRFESQFWSGGDLSALYRNIETKGRAGKGVTTVTGLPLPPADIEALAAQHPLVSEMLFAISRNVRDTATALEILVALKATSNYFPDPEIV